MKWIQNKLCLGMAILGISIPLQVHAAGQDGVSLNQDGNQVAVSLEMSNASEEKITTAAVSLEVKTEDLSQVKVAFQFSPEVGKAQCGYVYHEDTGRLDVYVSSGKDSLFREEKLNLGSVQVEPANPDQSLSADIGYCKNSFHTANSAYGDKSPVVENEVASVTIQIGNGSLTPPSPNPGTGNSDNTNGGNNTNTGTNTGGSGGGGSQGGSRNEGLYDETTRFQNDPSSARPITSSVVKREGKEMLPISLSEGAAAAIAGKNGAGTGKVELSGTRGKVSVVSPKNGPASILISKEKKDATENDMPSGLLTGIEEESFGEKAGGLFGKNNSEEDGSGEILLDQEKGGAVDNSKSEMRSRIILFSVALVGVVIAVGTVIVLLVKRNSEASAYGRRKKKRRKRKKKKTVRRK